MLDILVAIAVIVVPSALAIVVIDAIHGSVVAYRTRDEELGAAGVFWDRPVSTVHVVDHVDQPARDQPDRRRGRMPEATKWPVASEPRATPPVISGAQPHS